MAKKVVKVVKLQIAAGKANPAPPVYMFFSGFQFFSKIIREENLRFFCFACRVIFRIPVILSLLYKRDGRVCTSKLNELSSKGRSDGISSPLNSPAVLSPSAGMVLFPGILPALILRYFCVFS